MIKQSSGEETGRGMSYFMVGGEFARTLGLDFTLAKAIGLFAGATTTITSSIMNIKRKVFDYKFVFPIALMMLLFTPIGAYSSRLIDEEVVKFLFMLMLFYSASMMMFGKKKAFFHVEGHMALFIVGAVGGYIGNYMMHFKLNQGQIKKLMAIILYMLALKLLSHFLF